MPPAPPSAEAAELYERIARQPGSQRRQIAEDVARLGRISLAWALRALFRQQARSGYVLFDPAADPAERRCLDDPELGIILQLQWNPQRALRKQHRQLVERGVLAGSVDASKLIHRDSRGVGCYLCHENIALQNPREITLPLALGGDGYHLGANFAPIADNHFTVMSDVHRPQRFHPGIVRAGLELVAATGGEFRAVFNGRAGASIEAHEHLQATDLRFPIERLRVAAADLRWQDGATRLSLPPYYLPLWLIEGEDIEPLVRLADRCIRSWEALDPERHTENLIMAGGSGRYRLFVLLRDRRRLTTAPLRSAMASFEAGGLIVLSSAGNRTLRRLFETADAATLRTLLRRLRPEQPPLLPAGLEG